MQLRPHAGRAYLACPYSHPDKSVREERVRRANMTAAYLMAKGYVVFSPLTNSHYIAEYLDNHNCHEFWLTQDASHLDSCDKIFVLQLDGWKDSYGVTWETGYMMGQKKDVIYLAWEKVAGWYQGRIRERENYQAYTEKLVCPDPNPFPSRMDGHA